MESLVEKYKPETLDEIFGHKKTIGKVKNWAENWESGDEALIFHGPPGTGKTSTAECVAKDYGWEYVETNASSQRKREDIEHLAQEIRSTGERPTLYLFDEVDAVNGNSLRTIYPIIEDANNPVIFTANELWKVPDGLKKKCKTFKYKVDKSDIKKALRHVVKQEDIDISNRQIGQLATRDGIRDALNDLQEYVESGKTDWDGRDTDDSPFGVTRRILLNEDFIGDITPDDMVAFLNENTKNEFDGVEAMRSYQALSEADKWLEQTNSTQDYSWWRYASPIAQEVSQLRITEPYSDWVNVNYPSERRNYQQKYSSDTKEAELYRQVKSDSEYSGSFDFHEFKEIIIPMLKDLSESEKRELIMTHSLSPKAMKCIGVSEKEFDDWQVQESKGTKSDGNASLGDFVETDKTDDQEKKGIFDF